MMSVPLVEDETDAIVYVARPISFNLGSLQLTLGSAILLTCGILMQQTCSEGVLKKRNVIVRMSVYNK